MHVKCTKRRCNKAFDLQEFKLINCRFQVTFQSTVPTFVVNIPKFVSKFGILGV